MNKWIKNATGGSKTWLGQVVASSAFYEIQTAEELEWINDSTLISDIGSGDAIVAKDNSGDNNITDVNDAINYLKDNMPKEVKIQEEDVPTGGNYQAQGYEIDVLSSDSTKSIDVSFPIDIGLLSAEWCGQSAFDTDKVEFQIAPDTSIGTITANVATSATVIDVTQAVIDNIKKGYYVKITDGTNTDDCGMVLSKDIDNLKITVETATINSFLSATPTYIKTTIKLIPSMYLNQEGIISLGGSKIGASYIKANTVMKAIYTNNAGTAKKFRFVLEYLY